MVENQLDSSLHLLLQGWLPSRHPKTPSRQTVGMSGGSRGDSRTIEGGG